jgi:hypothetical protein
MSGLELISFAAALILSLVYLLGSKLEHYAEHIGYRRSLSFAAGVTVASVFVDVMPELSLHNHRMLEHAGTHFLVGEQRIYALALCAFVILYGLSNWTLARPKDDGETDKKAEIVGWIHVGGFAAYSWLIGYLLSERAEQGRLSLTVFEIAMGLHFLILDHTLVEMRGEVYKRRGRWVLAASVPLGWLVGHYMPLSEIVMARMYAVLAGGMIITTAISELPGERQGRFLPFFLGAAAYTLLILAV